jgi:Ca2+-binding RTX toxin-like protein
MSTIGGNFTFSANGTEDLAYGFSYSTMKPVAHESADTDAFLITGLANGNLFYNAGSLAAPHYFQISAWGADPYAPNALELRITGVFINGVKVSGSDGNLYWTPESDSSVSVPGASTITLGTPTGWTGGVNAVYVNAVDNVDGTFNNGFGNVLQQDTVGAGPDAIAIVNLLAPIPPPALPTVVLFNDTTNGALAGYATDGITSDLSITTGNLASGSTFQFDLTNNTTTNTSGWVASYAAAQAAWGTADDPYTLQVRETDGVLFSAAATLNFTLDTTAPVAPTVTLVADTTDGGLTHDTDLVTSNPALNVVGEVGAVNMYQVDAGGFAGAVGALADGLHTVDVYQIDIANNSNAGIFNSVTFTLDTTADVAGDAALTFTAPIDSSNVGAAPYTIAGLDTDANAVITFSSSGDGNVATVTANLAWANNGANTVDLSSLSNGTISATMAITDFANNTASGAANTTTLLIVSPQYESAVYDAGTGTVTLTGINISLLLNGGGVADDGTGTVGTDITGQLDLTKILWDIDNGGVTTYAFTGAVTSAFVLDDYTLVLNTDGSIGAVNANLGTNGTNVNDSIDISNGFSTDTGGFHFGADGVLGITVLGALNEPQMPHTYTMDLGGGAGTWVQDDTLGVNTFGAVVTFDATAGDVLHIGMGTSAAGVDLYNFGPYDGGDSSSIGLVQSNHFDGNNTGNAAYVQIDNFSAATGGTPAFGGVNSIVFDDGSMLKVDVSAVAGNTLTGGIGGDQLIANDFGARLAGNAGDDLLIGGTGNDQIYGGSGNDVIYSAGGNNYLSGGSGNDIFVYSVNDSGHDTIADFNFAVDTINVGNASAALWTQLTTGAYDGITGILQSGNDTLIVLSTTETIRVLGQTMANVETALTNNPFNLDNGPWA